MRRDELEANFEQFVQARSNALLRACYLLTGDRGHAEDLLQTALAGCYRHWSRATADGREEAYVRTAIVNAHISAVRRRRLKEIITLRVPERVEDSAVAGLAERDRLRRALARLAPRTRTAVVLRHYVGLSEREVSEAMNCSPGNVKRLTSRAIAQLRTALGWPGGPPDERVPAGRADGGEGR